MTAPNHIPNEDQLRRAYLGIEAETGVLVPPTFRVYGDFQLNRARPLADVNEYAGDFFPDRTAVRGAVVVDGTFSGPLAFEDLAIYPRLGLEAAPAGVSDGQTTPGYLYEYQPDATSVTRDTASGELGFPGLPFTATGIHWQELTISADMDDAEASWRWSSPILALTKNLKDDLVASATASSATSTTITVTAAGWTVDAFIGAYLETTGGTGVGQIREVTDNTADTITVSPAFVTTPDATTTFRVSGRFTPGIPDRTRETIDAPGTDVFIDDHATGTIGTTNENARVISWSVTVALNTAGKRFMSDVDGFSRFGKGGTRVTGQLVMEFDSRDEYDAWVAEEPQIIRFAQTGSTIDSGAATTKEARIDVFKAEWDSPTFGTRENNVTVSLPFRGYLDETEAVPIEIAAKTTQATLP